MKKVLFIIQSFPSIRSANVLCDTEVMYALKEDPDIEIHCLAYKCNKQSKEETNDGIHIHRYNRGVLFDIYMWARENDNTLISKMIQKAHRVIMRIKQVIFIPIYPCYEPIASLRCAHAAYKIVRRNNIDMIVAEHNGIDTLYAGSHVKNRMPHIKFVAILWDPYTGKILPKYLPTRYSKWRLENSEIRLLSSANLIISMVSSKQYHEENSKRKSYYNKYVYLDIPRIKQIYLDCSNIPSKIKPGKINILYAGVLDLPERDPEPIIEVFSRIGNAKDINLIFCCIGNGREKLNKLTELFPGNVVISPYVEKKELFEIYQYVDALISIGGTNPYMVPSKIFEYMSLGKPIINMTSIDNDAAQTYLEKYPLSVQVSLKENHAISAKKLEMFIANEVGKTVDFNLVKEIYRDNTPERYVQVLQDALKK